MPGFDGTGPLGAGPGTGGGFGPCGAGGGFGRGYGRRGGRGRGLGFRVQRFGRNWGGPFYGGGYARPTPERERAWLEAETADLKAALAEVERRLKALEGGSESA